MDDLRTDAELLRLKAELLVNLGTEVRDMAASLARRAGGASAAGLEREPVPVDVSDLLPDARRAYAELRAAGMKVNQTSVLNRLRDYGHKAGSEKAHALWRALAAENVPPLTLPGRMAPPDPLPKLADELAPHVSLNGHTA